MTASAERGTSAAATASRPPPAAEAVVAPAKSAGRKRVIDPFILVAVAIGVTAYWLYVRQFEETDDAQIDANISNISPRVSGTITAVNVIENQHVKAGDVLAEIDPRDLKVAVKLAKAQVAEAEAQLKVEDSVGLDHRDANRTTVATSGADLASAEAALAQARKSVDQLAAQLVAGAGERQERAAGEAARQAAHRPAGDSASGVRPALARRRTLRARTSMRFARRSKRRGQASASKRRASRSTQSRLVEVKANAPAPARDAAGLGALARGRARRREGAARPGRAEPLVREDRGARERHRRQEGGRHRRSRRARGRSSSPSSQTDDRLGHRRTSARRS